MATLSSAEVIRKHEILQGEEQEIAIVESSSFWKKARAANEDQANNALQEFAFGTVPEDPIKAFAWYTNLRTKAQTHLWLIQFFDAAKDRNIRDLNSLLNDNRPTVGDREDTDLDSGKSQY